jgi:hypothetical protein
MRTDAPEFDSIIARDGPQDPVGDPRPATDPSSGIRRMGRAFRPIAPIAVRNVVLIAVAILLILVLLPSALAAAGPG